MRSAGGSGGGGEPEGLGRARSCMSSAPWQGIPWPGGTAARRPACHATVLRPDARPARPSASAPRSGDGRWCAPSSSSASPGSWSRRCSPRSSPASSSPSTASCREHPGPRGPGSRARVARARGAPHQRRRRRGTRRDCGDDDPHVRAAALGALVRAGHRRRRRRLACRAADDPLAGGASARRRARARARTGARRGARTVAPAARALDDADVTVVEAAAWALGELDGAAANAVDALAARGDRPPRRARTRSRGRGARRARRRTRRCRRSSRRTDDKPAVRRRAVLALAPFDGPEVDAALARAHTDRDWQVRQAAEDLTGEPG